MSRLPNPGADNGVWGDILNDFLLQEYNPDGTLKIRADNTFEPAIVAGSTGQYWRGDKSWQILNKATVGLAQVDNTSDAAKPISTASQVALDGKISRNGDSVTGDLALNANVNLTFNGANQYLRWDSGEGLWLAVADDNKNLKISYGGGSGRFVIDQYGFGEVARFTNGVLSMRSHNIKDIANPSDPQDAVTKAYVDAETNAIANKSSDYVLGGADHTILVNAGSGAVNITLPAAASSGKTYIIKKIDASANAVMVAAQPGQSIDGSLSVLLGAQWRYVNIQFDGSQWFIIGNN
jgi:hypothetical protein